MSYIQINPISGTQGKEQILKWLDEKLDKSRYIPEVIYTERAGHAVEIAALKAKEEAFAVDCFFGIHRDLQMACKPVSRTAWNDSQCSFGMYQ